MKRVDLYYNFCNPSVLIVPSSACGLLCTVVLCGRQAKLFFSLGINMNNAWATIDKGLGFTKLSPWLCRCYGCCIKSWYCHYKQNTASYLLDHKQLLFQHPQHISMSDLHTHLHKQTHQLIYIGSYICTHTHTHPHTPVYCIPWLAVCTICILLGAAPQGLAWLLFQTNCWLFTAF